MDSCTLQLTMEMARGENTGQEVRNCVDGKCWLYLSLKVFMTKFGKIKAVVRVSQTPETCRCL